MQCLYTLLNDINSFGNSSTNYGSLVSGLLVVIISGVIIFFIKDVLKKPPSLTNTFFMSLKTEKSSYGKYIGLTSFYTLNLIDHGNNNISGRIEKTHDIENDSTRRNYTGKQRDQGVVHGCIERVYFGRNKINFLIEIEGQQRRSSIVVKMPYIKTKKMIGTFSTTAADSSGVAIIQNSVL